jgi:histidinol-phosphate/aromatic aminotransferase/cobyric acid decarboxylase-like protein
MRPTFTPSLNCSADNLVARDQGRVILQTFSKLYGMAKLRAGVAVGHPELLTKLKYLRGRALPVTLMVGAHVSLKMKSPHRRAPHDHR